MLIIQQFLFYIYCTLAKNSKILSRRVASGWHTNMHLCWATNFSRDTPTGFIVKKHNQWGFCFLQPCVRPFFPTALQHIVANCIVLCSTNNVWSFGTIYNNSNQVWAHVIAACWGMHQQSTLLTAVGHSGITNINKFEPYVSPVQRHIESMHC